MHPEPIASPAQLDLIWGSDDIARAIGRTKRQTYHMLEAGELPAKKVGGRWVASLEALRRHFATEAA